MINAAFTNLFGLSHDQIKHLNFNSILLHFSKKIFDIHSIIPGKYTLHLLDQELETNLNCFFKTLILNKEVLRKGVLTPLEQKCEVTIV